jgi:plasmid stability protein
MHGPTVRTTIYLDAALHEALRLKAATARRSMSALVNEAVRAALQEDEDDLAAFAEREQEPSMSYEAFLAQPALADAAQREQQADRATAVIDDLQQYASTGGRKFTRDEMNER